MHRGPFCRHVHTWKVVCHLSFLTSALLQRNRFTFLGASFTVAQVFAPWNMSIRLADSIVTRVYCGYRRRIQVVKNENHHMLPPVGGATHSPRS
jgi:hypothetical protein